MNHSFPAQADYLGAYGSAFFGLTAKKAGYDALRHLEILLSGAAPYFLDVDAVPPLALYGFPKAAVRALARVAGAPRVRDGAGEERRGDA